MPEQIYKLQPDRTLALRGFTDLGAGAAVHAATPNSFTVSGVFRDAADFAVLVLYDAHNYYEHPRLKYLPDSDFTGLKLQFDVQYSGLMPLDSPKYATIDWPFLDVILDDANGTPRQIPLLVDASGARKPPYATAQQVGGTFRAASGQFVISGGGFKQYDRVTLWYLNQMFDYTVPQIEYPYAFVGAGAGTVHWVKVNGIQYSYTETAQDTNTSIAAAIVAVLAAAPEVTATQGDGGPDLEPPNQVNLRAKLADGGTFGVSASSPGSLAQTLNSVQLSTVAAALAQQMNGVNWDGIGTLIGLQATANGTAIQITAARPGVDGNMITMYATSKNSRLTTASPVAAFQGGSSDAVWRVTVDFSAAGCTNVRQMWLTFSPALANGAAFTDSEWQAVFTNWTVTGPAATRLLKVAGPNSVRIEENDAWCVYSGNWQPMTSKSGFYSGGFAKRASTAGAQVTVTYTCQLTHDLYLGTSLYATNGTFGVSVDGGAETDAVCALQNTAGAVVFSRLKLRSGLPAGKHTVVLRWKTGGPVDFDFLEAAVASDVPDALPVRPGVSPALDYSTDHTYKISPQRLLWMFDKLGFAGPVNEYLGVFWWNQRKRVNANLPSAVFTFGGTFAAGDQIVINISGQIAGKSVFYNDDNTKIASHFAFLINATYVGVWASAAGPVLTVTVRSPLPAYAFDVTTALTLVQGSSGTLTATGDLKTGAAAGTWVIDPTQSPALNRGARDWHANFYSECARRNREVLTACSMELVNPPAGFAAQYQDGQPVITDVGFGSLKSTHCAFNSLMAAYQLQVYSTLASLMMASGTTPNLQFGEFLWWFFKEPATLNPAGTMAYYDSETQTAAQAALGRPLAVFRSPNDDPAVNGGADATFLRNRLRDYVRNLGAGIKAAYPLAQLEILFPYDVNYPVPVGVNQLGGRMNNFINFPVEWHTKATSGVDRMKMEALDFGSSSRDMNLAAIAIQLPLTLGWPKNSVRYLVPLFNGGCPWQREYRIAVDSGVPVINFWAFDHVCLFNWPTTEPPRGGTSMTAG